MGRYGFGEGCRDALIEIGQGIAFDNRWFRQERQEVSAQIGRVGEGLARAEFYPITPISPDESHVDPVHGCTADRTYRGRQAGWWHAGLACSWNPRCLA